MATRKPTRRPKPAAANPAAAKGTPAPKPGDTVVIGHMPAGKVKFPDDFQPDPNSPLAPLVRTNDSPVSIPKPVEATPPPVDDGADAFDLQTSSRALDPQPPAASFDLDYDDDAAASIEAPVGGGSLTAAEMDAIQRHSDKLAFQKIQDADLKVTAAPPDTDSPLNSALARMMPDGPVIVPGAEAEKNADEFARWQAGQIKRQEALTPRIPDVIRGVELPDASAHAVNTALSDDLGTSRLPVDTGMQGAGQMPGDMTEAQFARLLDQVQRNGQITPVARHARELGAPVCFVWSGDTYHGLMTPAERDGIAAFKPNIRSITLAR